MNKIIGQKFALADNVTQLQIADLAAGFNAAAAFWNAAIDHDSYAYEHLRPHGRCIYSALSVVDVLKSTGRPDAYVQKVGLEICRFAHDGVSLTNSITVGNPEHVHSGSERRWNAHLIVRLGDTFIDPSIAQARRPWNDVPHFSAMINAAPVGFQISVAGETVKSKASWVHKIGRDFLRITYFDLLREQDLATRQFLKAPDAKLEARQEVVKAAVQRLKQLGPHEGMV